MDSFFIGGCRPRLRLSRKRRENMFHLFSELVTYRTKNNLLVMRRRINYFYFQGVGFNNDPEHLLSLSYPQCQFLAVDPVTAGNQELFTKKIPHRSRFREAVVSGQNESSSAYIRRKQHQHFHKIKTEVLSGQTNPTRKRGIVSETEIVEHIGLGDLLIQENYTSDSVIDLLLMDIDGPEYSVLESLTSRGASNF